MMMALCFQCGSVKFGAICPCPRCGIASTGDMNLDIAFSDHHMSVETLGAFGKVVRSIREACEDDQLRFWSFIRFVSLHHGDILGVQMPAEQAAECDDVLARAHPPAVAVEASDEARFLREYEERSGKDGVPDDPPDGGV